MKEYVQAYNLYATATDLWNFALPAETLFCDPNITSGGWSAILDSNVGQGILRVDETSVPLDDMEVVVRCVASGNLNIDGFLNPGVVPKFQISLDGGTTYGAIIEPKMPIGLLTPLNTNIIDYPKGGFRLILQNAPTYPSFIGLQDVWRFQTYVSPDVVRYLSSASRFVESYLQNTYQLPYESVGDDVKRVVCKIAAWYLIQRRGQNQGQDLSYYEPKEEMKWLEAVSKGDIQPNIKEQNSGKTFSSFLVARKPFKTYWDF